MKLEPITGHFNTKIEKYSKASFFPNACIYTNTDLIGKQINLQ